MTLTSPASFCLLILSQCESCHSIVCFVVCVLCKLSKCTRHLDLKLTSLNTHALGGEEGVVQNNEVSNLMDGIYGGLKALV